MLATDGHTSLLVCHLRFSAKNKKQLKGNNHATVFRFVLTQMYCSSLVTTSTAKRRGTKAKLQANKRPTCRCNERSIIMFVSFCKKSWKIWEFRTWHAQSAFGHYLLFTLIRTCISCGFLRRTFFFPMILWRFWGFAGGPFFRSIYTNHCPRRASESFSLLLIESVRTSISCSLKAPSSELEGWSSPSSKMTCLRSVRIVRNFSNSRFASDAKRISTTTSSQRSRVGLDSRIPHR